MKKLAQAMLAVVLLGSSMTAMAQKDPDLGGVAMSTKKTIVENATNSPVHHRFVEAIKIAGLTDTLNGRGPFTVFEPTDDAFAKLPSGTLTRLEKPENKAELSKILSYHVVQGKLSAKKLSKLIKKAKKAKTNATLKTLSGGTLIAKLDGSVITLTDEKGTISFIITPDIVQKNGVAHVVDSVLMPN